GQSEFQAVVLNNSILAANTGGLADFVGQYFSGRYNLIEVDDDGEFDAGFNLVGTSANPLDPELGPLANNGGRTRTHELLPGSPAINAGDPSIVAPPDFDQRTIPRILDGRLDIGAVEAIQGVAQIVGSGNLKITGTDVADSFRIDPTSVAGEVQVSLAGQHVGFFSPTGRIEVDTFDGDDFVRIDEAITLETLVRGGNGNDELIGGSGPDRLIGNANNDILRGRDGDDTLFGGSGIDDITGGSGNDSINGGNGNDVIDGNSGNDTIVGSNGNDSILGGGGVDDINGGAGDDFLDGGGANDTLTGGDDDDILLGGSGDDTLTGSADADILIGGIGVDTLVGSNGEDILIGGTTAYDADSLTLESIRNEWDNVGTPYLTRIANIRFGVSGFALTAGVTVFNDGSVDSLTGNAQLDWYFNIDDEDDLFTVAAAEIIEMMI
ncbi:MAG: calcium-binding protein, partial [Planctomycetota bacterium]